MTIRTAAMVMWAAGLLTAVASASDAPLQPQSPPSLYAHRIAICIGINTYSEYPPLKCASSDALAMASTFRDYGFDRVIVLSDAEATRQAILDTLSDVKATLGRDDLVVVYYAGHGWTVREESDRRMGYLVPFDCRRGYEAQDGISMTMLGEYAGTLPSRHSLFLMDACYSGYGLASEVPEKSMAGAATSPRPMAEVLASPVIQILTAGGEMDKAFEAEGHGLFTRHILKYLNRKPADGTGSVVSATELAATVSRKVSRETGGWQKPKFGLCGAGDVLLYRAPGIPSGIAMLTPAK